MKVLATIVMAGLVGVMTVSTAFAGESCTKSCSMSSKKACSAAGISCAATESKSAGGETKAAVAYPLDKCIVTGEKLGGMGDPVVKVYNGREVKFCCNGCVSKFGKDQAGYFKKIDDAVVAMQKSTYPLQTCPVSGEKLGSGGMEPVDYVYQNRLVRLCCSGCISTFEKDPAKYLKKIDEAMAAAPAKSEPAK